MLQKGNKIPLTNDQKDSSLQENARHHFLSAVSPVQIISVPRAN